MKIMIKTLSRTWQIDQNGQIDRNLESERLNEWFGEKEHPRKENQFAKRNFIFLAIANHPKPNQPNKQSNPNKQIKPIKPIKPNEPKSSRKKHGNLFSKSLFGMDLEKDIHLPQEGDVFTNLLNGSVYLRRYGMWSMIPHPGPRCYLGEIEELKLLDLEDGSLFLEKDSGQMLVRGSKRMERIRYFCHLQIRELVFSTVTKPYDRFSSSDSFKSQART